MSNTASNICYVLGSALSTDYTISQEYLSMSLQGKDTITKQHILDNITYNEVSSKLASLLGKEGHYEEAVSTLKNTKLYFKERQVTLEAIKKLMSICLNY
jgi:hypothetical protein